MSFRKPPSDVERMTSLRVGNLPFRTVQEVRQSCPDCPDYNSFVRTCCLCLRSTETWATSTCPSREAQAAAEGLPS